MDFPRNGSCPLVWFVILPLFLLPKCDFSMAFDLGWAILSLTSTVRPQRSSADDQPRNVWDANENLAGADGRCSYLGSFRWPTASHPQALYGPIYLNDLD